MTYFESLLRQVGSVASQLYSVVFALVFVVFFLGIAVVLFQKRDSISERGRSYLVWGVVALFVFVAVWGIIGLFAQLFGVSTNNTNLKPPTVQFSR
ncbi:MAG: hypothetical protein KatS3mg100_598 [Candidatus Parcubacteria bacterium]|nr:MAG: hypothetical protein KatS3mg100_598 [Candidatus Parcubacteria bacterium]